MLLIWSLSFLAFGHNLKFYLILFDSEVSYEANFYHKSFQRVPLPFPISNAKKQKRKITSVRESDRRALLQNIKTLSNSQVEEH